MELVRARQQELGLPEAFEWIAEVTPAMEKAAEAAGLLVFEYALMVLGDGASPAQAPDGFVLRLVTPEDDVAALGRVAAVSFGAPVEQPEERSELVRARLAAERTVMAAAFHDGVPVAVGVHQPVGDVTEVAGVGTLPDFRRQGLGTAVTALLVEDARRRGVQTVFLSAGDEATARLYARLGFVRAGTSCAAGP
ncbi:MAG: GNAT family N-acetyltransferase [Gaiellaceae bacterium]